MEFASLPIASSLKKQRTAQRGSPAATMHGGLIKLQKLANTSVDHENTTVAQSDHVVVSEWKSGVIDGCNVAHITHKKHL